MTSKLTERYNTYLRLRVEVQKLKNEFYAKTSIDQRCPRKLSVLPTTPCPKALASLYPTEHTLPKDCCEWYILDAASNYCFFAYEQFSVKEHTLAEIASLTATTVSSTDNELKLGLTRFKDLLKKE